jgi:hypothetical protein
LLELRLVARKVVLLHPWLKYQVTGAAVSVGYLVLAGLRACGLCGYFRFQISDIKTSPPIRFEGKILNILQQMLFKKLNVSSSQERNNVFN